MRLNDGKPWFRRSSVIGRWPITLEGTLLILFGMGAFILAVATSSQLPAASPWREPLLWFAFLVAIGVNAVAFWKTEDSF